jgi:ABC-type Mn2+/Zn2+ transport system ATPase subunit
MVGDPEILVLDEPMLGVDPVGRVQIRDILGGLKKEGKTIIFSSHELTRLRGWRTRSGWSTWVGRYSKKLWPSF